MTYSSDRILLGSQRESRISRFRPWVLFVVPLIAILLQVYIPLFFRFLTYLDLPLLVTVYFALMRRSPIAGTFIGAFIGLAQDSLSKNPLGPAVAGLLLFLLSPVLLLGHGAGAAGPASELRTATDARRGAIERSGRVVSVPFPGQAAGDDVDERKVKSQRSKVKSQKCFG